MERWIFEVETNCTDPKREKEFNEWYDNIHLRDMLKVPGTVRASRYELTNQTEGQAKFLAVYEAETNDINRYYAALGEQMTRVAESGRMSDLCVVAGFRAYRQITPAIES